MIASEIKAAALALIILIAVVAAVYRPADFEHFQLWHGALLAATGALAAWLYNYRRYRAFADQPTAKIASAPQGYVELCGIGRALDGIQLIAPLSGQACLWYRLQIERRDNDKRWEKESTVSSDDSFILKDQSGFCVVDPVGAKIETPLRQVETHGDTRSTQWLLVPGMQLTLLGDFVTRSASSEQVSENEDVRELLAAWKRDGETRRFDLDKNGELSMQEWELARAAARREVIKRRQEADKDPELHLLRAPADGRNYVIAAGTPEAITRRYARFAGAALSLLVIALGVAIYYYPRGG